jgi:hypothetical protein
MSHPMRAEDYVRASPQERRRVPVMVNHYIDPT